VQATKQPKQQGATQEEQGTTARCRKQQGATQEEQGTTSKIARRKKNNGRAMRLKHPSNKNNKAQRKKKLEQDTITRCSKVASNKA